MNISGGSTDYIVNVFDSGTDDGEDTLTIYGTDEADDVLLRASKHEFEEGGVAFVAFLNGDPHVDVERVNYSKNLEHLTVETLGGEDHITLDDNWTETTVLGGEGADHFQVGQIFKTERDAANANIAPFDEFETLQTTRGYLSNGVSYVTVLEGNGGDDEFIVFRNVAVLDLFGNEGDDMFVIRSFAEEGSTESGVNAGECGYDQYVINGLVNVNGGDGNDTLRIIGTEFSDIFVITAEGIVGAGRTVNYTEIENLELDGLKVTMSFTYCPPIRR